MIYGVELSRETISTISDRVLEGLAEWQNRPLDPAATARGICGLWWAKPAITSHLPGTWQGTSPRPVGQCNRGSKRFGEPLAPAGFRPPYVRNHCYAGAHSGTS